MGVAPKHEFVGYNNCVHQDGSGVVDMQQSTVTLDKYNLPINSVQQCANECNASEDCWGFEYYDTQYIGRDMAGFGFCHLVNAFEKNTKGVSNRDAILPAKKVDLNSAPGERFGKGKAGIKSTNLLGVAYADSVSPRVKTKAELGSGASCYAKQQSMIETLSSSPDTAVEEMFIEPIEWKLSVWHYIAIACMIGGVLLAFFMVMLKRNNIQMPVIQVRVDAPAAVPLKTPPPPPPQDV